MEKDFNGWMKKKRMLHNLPDEKIAYFYERELWWSSLGINVGFEQDGKNEHFERPILILRKFNKHLFLAVPQTSTPREGKFFYKVTREGKDYFLILSQIRVMSSKRLLRKLGTISEEDFNRIKNRLREIAL